MSITDLTGLNISETQTRVDKDSKIITDIVNEIVKPYCKDVDNYVSWIREILADGTNPPTDEELEALMSDTGLVRNRNKIFSVRSNAKAVLDIQQEFGSFDAYVWHFTEGRQIDEQWKSMKEVPAVTDLSRRMSSDMKKRGIRFMGPVITYSFMQAVGIVNDHLADCEYR